MSDFNYKEIKLEDAIEEYLINDGGYIKGEADSFDRMLALDTGTLLSFINQSQPKQWKRFQAIYGDSSQKAFLDSLCKEIRMVGIIRVLRQGFTDRGIKFRLVYFKPETKINEDTLQQYEQNILTCVRQLHYSIKSENSLDMVLFVNGLPIVTMELKNQFTGQTVEHAKKQYMDDRHPSEPVFEFKNRALAHFAIDLNNVYMTTQLAKDRTRFLPFNQGSNGAGNVGGAGNPPSDNFPVAYLWEQVLIKDRLLEILQKYIHLERKEEKSKSGKLVTKETVIFPRYHQLDVVTKLLADVRENGSGKNYLIQHSAGSGKSNSIAWLAHRLSGLHNADDEKIFASVIVITDRKILDNQLQDTIYQFDHEIGVVEKIDKDSKQLRNAINDGKKIIITTLQKFPIIYQEVAGKNKNFALIVDEAHSSQTGKASIKLKRALADTEAILEEYAKLEYEDESERLDDEDKMLNELAAHGQHKNLSFFAFTATPKDKTLQIFGNKQPDNKYRAFHIYSMRQAIEEEFILDVLQNYMTYNMYFKIAKTILNDPELDTTQGARAITRFESLHPHNLAQKTIVMVEQFRNACMSKISGKAKAMVVTSSRLHAVRYLFEFRKYIKAQGYDDLDVLVAFSGIVPDDDAEWTEEKLNKNTDGNTIKESQLREYFRSDEFNMLIVAEKYQTGYDEPLLHTMFVDKKLSGVKAVQTLSRLNRIYEGKKDTFVLDFVNTAEDMQKSFQPYYEATILEEGTDPNIVYGLKAALDDYHIWQQNEVEKFAETFFKSSEQVSSDLGKLASIIQPALDRYNAKSVEDKDEIKSSLAKFIRIYSFVTQICRMFDKDLHRFSIYAKFLSKMLPKDGKAEIILDDKILLEYYKLEKDFEGGIALEKHEGVIPPIKGGIGGKAEKKEPLSVIVKKINERFNTSFTNMDKVMMQLTDDMMTDDKLVGFAKSNDEATFAYIFEQQFKEIAANRYEQNDEFFIRMFNDENFMKFTISQLMPEIYKKMRKRKAEVK
jgi:type I restriction enzyme R subunit